MTDFTPTPAAKAAIAPSILDQFPQGTILCWFNTGPIPNGWALCDGSNGTPDLIDRFPMGSRDNLGQKGGDHVIHIDLKTSTYTDDTQYQVSSGPRAPHSPGTGHRHMVQGHIEYLPSYTRIVYIMKI